ncbi:hypothetical protein ACOSP7_012159 [Xanthoceras sorbifolium]
MLEGKAVVGEADMLQKMQQELNLAAKALDPFDVTESIVIADFNKARGPGWQCILGTDFSSFVIHSHGCFIYFGIGSLAILLFRSVINQADEANLFSTLETVNALEFFLVSSGFPVLPGSYKKKKKKTVVEEQSSSFAAFHLSSFTPTFIQLNEYSPVYG